MSLVKKNGRDALMSYTVFIVIILIANVCILSCTDRKSPFDVE